MPTLTSAGLADMTGSTVYSGGSDAKQHVKRPSSVSDKGAVTSMFAGVLVTKLRGFCQVSQNATQDAL